MAFVVNALSPHGPKMAAMVLGIMFTFRAVLVSSPPMGVPCEWIQKLTQRCPQETSTYVFGIGSCDHAWLQGFSGRRYLARSSGTVTAGSASHVL